MANNQDNDEYSFNDLDNVPAGAASLDDEYSNIEGTPELPRKKIEANELKRNVLIIIVFLLVAFLLYKFLITPYFLNNSTPVKAARSLNTEPRPPLTRAKTMVSQTKSTAVVEPITPVEPVTPLVVSAAPVEDPSIKLKLETMEQSQQNLRSDLTAASNQLDTINNSMNELNTKMANLMLGITKLSETVELQASRIALLTVTKTKTKIVRKKSYKLQMPSMAYHLQAVIPGRAWLIAANGSTLTVREGSQVAGYGLVRLIDAAQGRITMSSGRVIRFSPQDS